MSILLKGIIAYPVTPFSADGGVDLKTLEALIERLIADGVHAIARWAAPAKARTCPTPNGRRSPPRRFARCAGACRPSSASPISPRRAQCAARFAEQAGADAVMVLPVSYWKLANDEIVAHYRAIGAAIGIPIMLYNNPRRAASTSRRT